MKRQILKRILATSVIFTVFFAEAGVSQLGMKQAMASEQGTYSVNKEYTSEMISNNYTKISKKYKSKAYTGESIVFKAVEALTDTTFEGFGEAKTVSLASSEDTVGQLLATYDKGNSAVDLSIGKAAEFIVNVPAKAQYEVVFEYASYDASVLPVELSVKVDNEFPFYECRNVVLETTWGLKPEKSYDRYNNEIVTIPEKIIQWETKSLGDSAYRYSGALPIELSEGEHRISLEVHEGTFLLGAIVLKSPETIPSYQGSKEAAGDALITIQAEEFTYRNDSSIHAVAEYDASLYPYDVKDTVLNTIDSASFDDAGLKVTYEFTAPQDGFYYLAMNYRQSDKNDFPVFFNVFVDGVIPSTAFNNYPMAYTNKYKVSTLTDENGDKLSVYLTKGVHTIGFQISNDPLREILEGLDESMSIINDLALEITKVAGTNSDKYRDLRLSDYIPTLESDLRMYADRLYSLQETVRQYAGNNKNIAVLAPMNIAAKQLISLAEEPDEIPYRISELSAGSSSANRQLANTVDAVLTNDIAIDAIYIYQESAVLPKKPNVFKTMALNVQRFFASFTDQAYSTANVDKNHLQVWVNRSSQYVQIMQKMIDEYFTPETGIEVDISIMPDQYKLVLANSAGNAPDVATGINYTIPYELAIRGALVDMTKFDSFKQVASVYEPGLFMTGTINDSVYSMPETMNFWVLFYRSDIMNKLGIEVPDTMQDVIDILPELQMRGLNYYQPVSGMTAMRNFHGTTPLINQFGGSLYKTTAEQGTNLGSAESIEGFRYLCELFTIYDMPINIDNFYQHLRNGDIPIGVADYGTYNLMKNAAPELKNSWEIGLVPGITQNDGTVDRTICGNAESVVIFKSNADREEKAWKFVEWWSSTKVQAEFGQTLQITYGDEYMWTSANLDAFRELPWDSDDKSIIIEQMSFVEDCARVPGTYLLERELSNAFNDIVVNGDTAQMRIDAAVKVINREINRKLEEFGYIDSEGAVLKEYKIPTIDRVKKILGR